MQHTCMGCASPAAALKTEKTAQKMLAQQSPEMERVEAEVKRAEAALSSVEKKLMSYFKAHEKQNKARRGLSYM